VLIQIAEQQRLYESVDDDDDVCDVTCINESHIGSVTIKSILAGLHYARPME